MTTKVEELRAEFEQLSEVELRMLIDQLEELLKQKNKPRKRGILARAYRPTIEEVEDSLSKRFTPEERAEAAKVDLSKLPPLLKTITEYIDEDREDRV